MDTNGSGHGAIAGMLAQRLWNWETEWSYQCSDFAYQHRGQEAGCIFKLGTGIEVL